MSPGPTVMGRCAAGRRFSSRPCCTALEVAASWACPMCEPICMRGRLFFTCVFIAIACAMRLEI
eukprot:scaffold80025_cov23-Tisochrysis_lutea.AAC.1